MKKIGYNKTNTIIIIVSLIIAFISMKMVDASATASQKQNEVTYLVAKCDLKAGDELTNDKVREVSTTEKDLSYISDFDDLKNMVATEAIYKDEPIVSRRINKKDDINQSKKKWYSIKLKPEEAVAGTIRPGDRVKIIGTLVSSTKEPESDYILKEDNGQPKSIYVKDVFDANGVKITETSGIPGIYVLEVNEDEATLLDGAVTSKKIRMVKDLK